MSMKITQSDDSPIIESSRDLADYLASGCKPVEDYRIGVEHEKFVYYLENYHVVPYQGDRGISRIMEQIAKKGWTRVIEEGKVIGLRKDRMSISLEPGGQFELSGAPLVSIHDTCREAADHLRQCKTVGDEMNLGFLGHGFNPVQERSEIAYMPKPRYEIMRSYMPRVGNLGLDMMLRTCTVQVNLDYASEEDMIEKFRVALALQPLGTALFANSPFTEGKPNGFLSYRAHIWTDTDPDRTGMLPFVFDDDFGFERYVDYVLDVPMYFLFRNGHYHDITGRSFRDLMAGRLEGFAGEYARLEDWKDHLSTTFPEVRLKTFMEMRGSDAGPWRRICALPALWVGLLYDKASLRAAWDLVRSWSVEDHLALHLNVPKQGLQTRVGDRSLLEVGREVLQIADAGLKARGIKDSSGQDERIHLAELHEIIDSGKTPAERLLEAYHGRWHGSLEALYEEEAY